MDSVQTAARRTAPDDGQTPSDPRWLPIAEAAQIMGLTIDALRKRAKRGMAEVRKGNDGRVMALVIVRTLSGRSPDIAADKPDTEPEPPPPPSDVERWRQLAEARAIALARVEELAKAAAELAAVQVQAAKREAADLRAALEREQARADRLETALARPWWRRLFGP